MEPKYFAFQRWLDTPSILWQGDWIPREIIVVKKNSPKFVTPQLSSIFVHPETSSSQVTIVKTSIELVSTPGIWTEAKKEGIICKDLVAKMGISKISSQMK